MLWNPQGPQALLFKNIEYIGCLKHVVFVFVFPCFCKISIWILDAEFRNIEQILVY